MAVDASVPRGHRPIIGLLLSNLAGGSKPDALRAGVGEAARLAGADVLCFAGGHLRDPYEFNAQANVIYDLAACRRLDGLIIWTSSVGSYIGRQATLDFSARLAAAAGPRLPVVSIGMALEGIPSLLVDSYGGMKEAVCHLIRDHGRRRLAFVRGPESHRDAGERYRAYRDVLAEGGLPPDERMVTPPGTWGEQVGYEAVRLLLDERRVRFDALVSVNDSMAAGALRALRERGLRVPDDVAIVGFDDELVSRVVAPPLTTVPVMMRERGRQAVDLVFAMMRGETAPAQLSLPTRIIVRRSCGCQDPLVAGAAAPRAAPLPAAQRLRAPFLADLRGKSPGAFLRALEEALEPEMDQSQTAAWHSALSALRAGLAPELAGDAAALASAEGLWQQARVMVGEAGRRAEAFRGWQSGQLSDRLRRLRQAITTAVTVDELAGLLKRELPLLGFTTGCLCLYEDPARPAAASRLVMAYAQVGALDLPAGGVVLPPGLLVPDGLLAGTPARSLVVQPLYFRDDQLGYVVLGVEAGAGGTLPGFVHQAVREQISSALKEAMLLAQNVDLYHTAIQAQQAAQQGQQAAEEANLLKSRFLSMVSHELLTPLVLLVGLSEMMLRTAGKGAAPEPLRQDLARLHASSRQLSSLVRDVLDLARSQVGQLRLSAQPLDLAEALAPVILVGEELARGKGLAWQADVPAGLPRVMGDATRLQQVALNLVTNAVKFTERGHVRLAAEAEGGSVTVSVSDSGLGVPPDEQAAIFDEFRQSERTAARGYGGLGVGLAICRQIVELHGGSIGVRSGGQEGSGSTFCFTLPALTGEAAAAPDSARSQSVLVLTGRAAGTPEACPLAAYLQRHGFAVEVARADDSAGWLDGVLAAPPGAIAMDLDPASSRGWSLMETLKANPATAAIPVLFYSLDEGQDAGAMVAVDPLAKALGPEALVQALERQGLGPADHGKTILVVDDDPAILALHARIVADHLPGCRVVTAANGRLALEAMARRRPDLVLLDLMMPEVDGMEVLRAMQEQEATRGVPVIVLTAQTLTGQDMERLQRGVAAVLGKGLFTAGETLEHVRRALARSPRLGSDMQRVVRQVMAYIHQHYAEAVTREDMAAYASVSPRHLARCFVEETGLSPMAYLQRWRVRQARRLLEETGMGITEVAGAVGFADGGHLARVFRQETGLSPREYRRGDRGPGTEPPRHEGTKEYGL